MHERLEWRSAKVQPCAGNHSLTTLTGLQ